MISGSSFFDDSHNFKRPKLVADFQHRRSVGGEGRKPGSDDDDEPLRRRNRDILQTSFSSGEFQLPTSGSRQLQLSQRRVDEVPQTSRGRESQLSSQASKKEDVGEFRPSTVSKEDGEFYPDISVDEMMSVR